MSESLQESMSSLKDMFFKRMAEFEAELPRSQGTPSMTGLAAEYNSFKAFVMEALNALQRQMELLARTVDAMEMRSRRKMLLLHGVAEDSKEDAAKVVIRIVKDHLKSDLTAADIRRGHRMGRSSNEHKPRPIVIKFSSSSTRDRIWFDKTKFKGTGITVSEFLTKQRHETFMSARQKYGVSQCWTKEGIIHVLAPDGTRHRVVCLSELQRIEQKGVEKPPLVEKPAAKTRRTAQKK